VDAADLRPILSSMELHISSPHVEVDAMLRAHVERCTATLARHFDQEGCDLHVMLERPIGETKQRPVRCVMRLGVPGAVLVARKSGVDAHTAVDVAVRALARELEAWKQRVRIGTRWPKKYYVARRVEWNTPMPGFAEEEPPEPRVAPPGPEESEEGVEQAEEEGGPLATYLEL
jgi:ribosomal subunit interface protein